MAVTINASDVKTFCPESSSFNDTVIDLYISTIDQSDACLDAQSVPDDIQKALKLSAVCHFLTKHSGGQVRSQSDFEGASITFDNYKTDSMGLASTTFGQFIQSSQYASCFSFMNKSTRFLKAVG